MTTRSYFFAAAFLCSATVLPMQALSSDLGAATSQTLVFVRHGEKPADIDNGQLTCQGANRATALPNVLQEKFGAPDYIFAVATVANKNDQGQTYYYLRALATIEPTAVQSGVTVNLQFAKDDIDDLQKELAKPQYQNATVFVAWEHNELDQLVANIFKKYGGDAAQIPSWDDNDYDSIFVLRLVPSGAIFEHGYEGLNDRRLDCQGDSTSVLRDGRPPAAPVRP